MAPSTCPPVRTTLHATGWADLAATSQQNLQALLAACDPAPFGVNSRHALRSLEAQQRQFSIRPDLIDTGIVEQVRSKLVDVSVSRKRIIPALYKLNVYDPGSFFKTHKDTPRSPNIFVSLVIVSSTQLEGGVLYLRHKGDEWTFDSATITSAHNDPSIPYVTLCSDGEHGAPMVTTWSRVTPSYNLYFDETPTGLLYMGVTEEDVALCTSLSALSDNMEFLPGGGYLGFGLRYQ